MIIQKTSKSSRKLYLLDSSWFYLHPRCNTANWTTESGFSGDLLVLSPGHHTSHANDMFTSMPNLLPGRGEIQILMRKFFCESRLEIPQTCHFCFIVCHSDSMMWFEGLFQPSPSTIAPCLMSPGSFNAFQVTTFKQTIFFSTVRLRGFQANTALRTFFTWVLCSGDCGLGMS